MAGGIFVIFFNLLHYFKSLLQKYYNTLQK